MARLPNKVGGKVLPHLILGDLITASGHWLWLDNFIQLVSPRLSKG